MSYILDALKKAEADRDPDTRARLAFEVREQRRNRLITYGVLAALIANAVILLWVFLPEELTLPAARAPAEPVEATTPAAAPTVSPAATPAVSPVAEPEPAAPAPVIAAPTTAPARAVSRPADMAPDEVLIGPRSAPASATPVTLSSLPDATRRRFPTLSFSTHIYAEEPDLRAVVVNGRRLVEGDRLGELRLERITEDGAVFLFEGRQVEVGVLEEWN